MHKVSNPHDKFFKEVFSRKETAMDFLSNHLPMEVLRALNLDAIEIRKDSFIDEELRESFSDLLYEVKLAGSRAYVYVLFEHKSFPDPLTAFQLLKYMLRIWALHLRQSDNKKLPLILPLVLYQGVGTWDVGNRLKDLMASEQEALFTYAPDFQFVLYDLSQQSDEQIKGDVIARAMLLAMKYVFSDELPEKLPDILALLTQLADEQKGLKCMEILFRYLVQATDKLSREDFDKAVSSLPEGDATMSTLAEQWFQEGMEKGLREGEKKGLMEGAKQGRIVEACEVIVELIEAQYGAPSQRLIEKLHQIRTHETLRMLRRQMKDCRSLAEFERLVEKVL